MKLAHMTLRIICTLVVCGVLTSYGVQTVSAHTATSMEVSQQRGPGYPVTFLGRGDSLEEAKQDARREMKQAEEKWDLSCEENSVDGGRTSSGTYVVVLLATCSVPQE